ncbi:MAG TPA: aminotransferase class III-fold pyridoxal phosphate-dependent enzyme [Anaerolineaceae bacterium]|nr:aminotransferase class III-fold pyridoxal phosphate-dependent enzyme [Anaerolineaceae bacterium]HOS53362.1 aminotransferase class III-fold pyridoxal phosphate-dependent enzyme [Anaerolineaceae bacterium]HPD62438.1 aminotransferase class III-fold pyridoxal phosphate-dependent enzyme [Anaerolineaceae bacterium]HQK04797.1 aminotransferase class III-fold pyridoxal phosphate-dependent enzyme [Anaerolineaceae bacterium]
MVNYQENLKHLSPVWTHLTDIVVDHAEGCYLYATDGRKMLDFTCGIGVTNTGHCHPKVVEAIRQQAGLLIHGQVNLVVHKPLLELVDELRTVLPSTLDGFFFSNSGAEAVEGALKLARHATGRPNVIVVQGSFHGRTNATMAMTTSKNSYKIGYQPLMPGVYVTPFPYALRYGWDEEKASQWCLDELELLLMTQLAPQETAAIFIEPIIGEGGYLVPPKTFMKGLRELTQKHGILLVADEVQSGFGRTGKWFGYQHFEIEPDIMTVAKGIASGMPISGVISRLELMSKWIPGSHGGTYGGNAVAAAAAVATIRTIKEEKIIENVVARGAQLKAGLAHLQEKYPQIADVRGLGLMVGTEFRDAHGKPDKKTTKAVQAECLSRQMMLLTAGPWDNTIRWIPPLVVTESQMNEALNIFESALAAVI